MSCVLPPVCVFCQHFLENNPDRECLAFEEIPNAIMDGKCDHIDPYPGDGGYRFQLIPAERETFLELNEVRREFELPEFRLPD
ncbi:hypothetical protein [Thiothrix lacustris]|uniref:hypothetical protein n=1 Tax=Thiothrix lacustris TaxID=525917 RepID=UPI00048EFDD0|nr:hypothetical protein [Thiothrix lacustris]